MNEIDKARLLDAKEYLHKSGLQEEHKDNLRGLLDLTSAVANGHTDKIQGICDVLLAMSIHEVRKEVRLPDKISDTVKHEVATHVSGCPMRGATGAMPKWVMVLYPFRWQLAIFLSVLSFAPEAPQIISMILKACRQ